MARRGFEAPRTRDGHLRGSLAPARDSAPGGRSQRSSPGRGPERVSARGQDILEDLVEPDRAAALKKAASPSRSPRAGYGGVRANRSRAGARTKCLKSSLPAVLERGSSGHTPSRTSGPKNRVVTDRRRVGHPTAARLRVPDAGSPPARGAPGLAKSSRIAFIVPRNQPSSAATSTGSP